MRSPLYLFVLFSLFIVPSLLFGQKQNNIWYFSYGNGVDFNTVIPTPLSDGKIETLEGCASIADRTTGGLLFYTDGVSVWNRDRQRMPNGFDLKGQFSSTQSALIVPMPGQPQRYYIFTADEGGYLEPPNEGIHYSVVDMRADGNRGDVIVKNTPLLANASERLTAVRQCDGQGYWVITVSINNDTIYAFSVTARGISAPVASAIGTRYGDTPGNALGYLKASPDGSRLGMVIANLSIVQLFRFDRQTGRASERITLHHDLEAGLYGLAFSPDNTKLYVPSERDPVAGICQYDLQSNDSATIVGTLARFGRYCVVLQLGPDGRIYGLGGGTGGMSMIDRPNLKAPDCLFFPDAIPMAAPFALGLPNMIDADYSTAPPAISAGRDTAICPGESVQLGATGAVEYRWRPEPSLTCTDCPNPVASPAKTTTYYLTGYGPDRMCPATDSVTVTVLPPASADAGPDRSICPGDTVRLYVPGGSRFRWSPNTMLSCGDCPNPVARPQTTATYAVTVTNAAGCTATDSITITVNNGPPADAGPDVAICPGRSAQLLASDGTSWLWSPADGLSCVDCRNPVASPDGSTSYSVTITSAGGCIASDTVLVSLHAVPIPDAGPDAAVCAGSRTQLHATGGLSYRWEPSLGLSCADCPDPIADPSATTRYMLTAFNEHGCSATDSITVTVAPLPEVLVGSDTSICTGGALVLHATGGITYSWSPADGLSCSDCPDPVARPTATTTYTVTATNADGCSSSDDMTVTVHGPAILDAYIATDYRIPPGRILAVPVMLRAPAPFREGDTLIFTIGYRATILRLEGLQTQGALLDGWMMETLDDTAGSRTMRFIAPTGWNSNGNDTLLRLVFRSYIGDTVVSDLPFSIALNNDRCLELRTAPGRITIDSICGLNFRLIELIPGSFGLKQNLPNPFGSVTSIEFSIGLDGPTRLEILNTQGAPVAVLVDQHLEPGIYTVQWDPGDAPTGLYYYRLVSGTWSRTERMVLAR